MKPVESVEHYRALKAAAKQRCGSLSSNIFLTNGGLARIMEQQGLEYAEYPQGVAFFTDEGAYYRVFYCLDSTQALPDMSQDKTVVIEEPDKAGRRKAYLDSFCSKLEASGWSRIARNVQVSSTLADRAQSVHAGFTTAIEHLEQQGMRLTSCPERHVNTVVSLWRDWLHVSDIPQEHTRFYSDSSQTVVCVLNENDDVCGVNWWRIRGNACEIRHTVTDPRFYQRGIGYTMQLAAMDSAIVAGCREVFTYIDDRNYRSLAMFRKAGICENGRITVQYGLEGSNNG